MMLKKYWLALPAACLVCLFMGCPAGESEFRELGENDNVNNTAPPEHHDHGAGPHGGHILEFGDYHGEITLADGIISVYVLGDDAKTLVPLANATVEVKLADGDKETSLQLAASPQEGEADGTSSTFVSAAGEVPESVKDIEQLTGSVGLKVGEKALIAEISHDHDHDHHDH